MRSVEVMVESEGPTPTSRVTGNGAGRLELGRVADDLLPALIARLGASELGELEVREDGWRIRLRRETSGFRAPEGGRTHAERSAGHTSSPGHATGSGHATSAHVPSTGAVSRPYVARRTATSPGVGYFSPRDGLAVGQPVKAGDSLGHIDVLGVRQDVVGPVDGVVGRILATVGEAVEYGQELVRIDGIDRESAHAGDGLESGALAPGGLEAGEPDVEAPEARAAD
jgi:biotin carboxyl carrier protein